MLQGGSVMLLVVVVVVVGVRVVNRAGCRVHRASICRFCFCCCYGLLLLLLLLLLRRRRGLQRWRGGR